MYNGEIMITKIKKIILLMAVCLGIAPSGFAQTFEHNGIKIEFSDKVKTPDEAIAYTASSKPVPVSALLSFGIRPVQVQITNTSDQPVMINARSVNVSLLSPKRATSLMQRGNSVTGYPYLESWAVYGLWSIALSLLQVPGQWIKIPKTTFTTPQSPEVLNTVGTGLESIGGKLLGSHSSFVRICGNYVTGLWNTPRSLHCISVVGFIMSCFYLGKIYAKNKRAEELFNALGGQLRLYYPVLIVPGQVVNKVLLLDERKEYVSELSFKIFAKNNQDEVAAFTCALDAY
jgi:hypothetical protein